MDAETNARYEATLTLTGFKVFTPNTLIISELAKKKFSDIVVEGTGETRQVFATWTGPSQKDVELPKEVSNVKKIASNTTS